MLRAVRRLVASLLLGLSLLGATPASGDEEPGPRRGDVVTVEVDGDRPAFVVHGAPGDGRVLVYLHGRCGDPHAGIRAFAEEVSAWGTLVSVQGDLPCPDRKGRVRWSADVDRAARRIDAAIAAVARQRKHPLDAAGRTLIGYSEGALRAESIAKMGRSRFAPLVMRPPSSVAGKIVRAIERDRGRVIVGPDAHLVSLWSRLAPGRSAQLGRLTSRI